MDTWRVDLFPDHSPGLTAETARCGAVRLSHRLAVLRQKLERDFPLAVALDVADRDVADSLPSDLGAAIHTVIQQAVLSAADLAGATLARVAVRAGSNRVMLRIDDNGGLACKGSYDLAELLADGAGPQALAQLVAVYRGRMRLDSAASGTRIEIDLPHDAGAFSAPDLAAE